MYQNTSVISMITDFGYRDGYAGIVKGVIASIAPQALVIDITHDIEPFNVKSAAFVLKNSWRFFPDGTIHLVIVDPGVGSTQRPVLITSQKSSFVGPDNGFISFVWPELAGCRAFKLGNPEYFLPAVSSTFHGRDIYGPSAAHLSQGVPATELAEEIEAASLARFAWPQVQVSGQQYQGEIVYIDRFGNLITNVSSQQLSGRQVCCYLDGAVIPQAKAYSEVQAGHPALIAGSHGFLEIAVFKGRADKMLKVDVGHKVHLVAQ